MPSRIKRVSGEAIEQRLALGFGLGAGPDYMPWYRTCDVPSRGTCSIITGWRHGREHHLLSRNERNFFYVLEWSDDVIEIREQFPLLPVEHTVEIARGLKVRHPHDKYGPFLLTSDFLIIKRGPFGQYIVIRTVKPELMLRRPRVLELFEIERIYWRENGLEDWGIVTEKDVPRAIGPNMHWLHECRDPCMLYPISPDEILQFQGWAVQRAIQSPWIQMAAFCKQGDAELSLIRGTGLKVMRHLIANKVFVPDITQRLRTDYPIQFTLRLQ
jgi:hypothetical protein